MANDHLEFNLPPDWVNIVPMSETTPSVFQTIDKKSNLTVTYQFHEKGISSEELESLFRAYFEVRIGEEQKHLTDQDVLEFSELRNDGVSVWQTFAGLERKTKRRFNGLVVAQNGKLVTFYSESLNIEIKKHNELVQRLFGSVEIK